MTKRESLIEHLQMVIDGWDPLEDSREPDDNKPVLECYTGCIEFINMLDDTIVANIEILHEYDGPVSLDYSTDYATGISRFGSTNKMAFYIQHRESSAEYLGNEVISQGLDDKVSNILKGTDKVSNILGENV